MITQAPFEPLCNQLVVPVHINWLGVILVVCIIFVASKLVK